MDYRTITRGTRRGLQHMASASYTAIAPRTLCGRKTDGATVAAPWMIGGQWPMCTVCARAWRRREGAL